MRWRRVGLGFPEWLETAYTNNGGNLKLQSKRTHGNQTSFPDYNQHGFGVVEPEVLEAWADGN